MRFFFFSFSMICLLDVGDAFQTYCEVLRCAYFKISSHIFPFPATVTWLCAVPGFRFETTSHSTVSDPITESPREPSFSADPPGLSNHACHLHFSAQGKQVLGSCDVMHE